MISGVDYSELPILGPVDGFWPVSGIEDPNVGQLWIPNALQDFEARCLARHIFEQGYFPDYVLTLARGGFMVAQAVAYTNDVKMVRSFQTIGYGKGTVESKTELVGVPALDPAMFNKKLLVVDELIDTGIAVGIVLDWIIKNLHPSEVKTAVLYDKDRPHVLDVDYKGRPVTNLWLDHESQADFERRNHRIQELNEHKKQITLAMGALSMLQATPEILRIILEKTADYYKKQ